MDHLHHDDDVLSHRGAKVVLSVALTLQLEYQRLHSHAPPAHATKALPQSVGHTLECILYEGLPLRQKGKGVNMVQSGNMTSVYTHLSI